MGWISGRRVGLIILSIGVMWLLTACDPPVDHVVNTTADGVDAVPGDGVCETDTDGECTLRAALMEANADPDHDRVILAEDATHVLDLEGTDEDAAATGDLDVSTRVTVAGNGATIDADGIDRVLQVLPGGRLTLADVAITGGSAPHGGGLLNQGSTTVRDATFSSNVADSSGGAIRNSATATGLTLERVTLAENDAPTGAALIVLADAAVHGSSIIGNDASNAAGAVRVGAGTQLTVTDSTFSGNVSATVGGALDNRGSTIAINTTFSGNVAARGGAIASTGHLQLAYSTVTANEGLPGRGAGIAILSGTTEVATSIIAGNVGDTDCNGPLTSVGGNLDGDGSCLATPAPGDQPATDPLLGPLADNGGSTLTHLPALTSPALDVLSPPCSVSGLPLTTDQRGEPRPVGAGCDAGAVEVPPLGDIVVDTAADGRDTAPGDGLCIAASGGCTLRAAIDEANATPAPDTIVIGPGIDPTLSIVGDREDENATGDLDVTADLTIEGNGATIDGNQIDRVLHHRAGALVLEHTTVTNGLSQGDEEVGNWEYELMVYGAGIRAEGPLTVRHSTISHNVGISSSGCQWQCRTISLGGGIYATDVLTVEHTTIEHNASSNGGGIYIERRAPGVDLRDVAIRENRTYRVDTDDGQTAENIGVAVHLVNTPLTVARTSVVDNGGGGLYSWAGLDGAGPAVDVTISITDSRFEGNVGDGVLTQPGSAIAGLTGNTTIENTSIRSNTGIGLRLSGHGVVRHSVVAGNSLNGVAAGGCGTADLQVTNSTVADNGAGAQAQISSCGALEVRSTTVRGAGRLLSSSPGAVLGSSALTSSGSAGFNACTAPVSSLGWNVVSDTSCGLTAPGDLEGVDPLLGALADNGGPTWTMLPLAGSPLLDRIPIGTTGLCDGTLPTDQRGFPRPVGAGCEVGAVEIQPGP
jgi:CSLREA domain-containing protein